jgi:hypothetical protein
MFTDGMAKIRYKLNLSGITPLLFTIVSLINKVSYVMFSYFYYSRTKFYIPGINETLDKEKNKP